MSKLWISTPKWTCLVIVEDRRIIETCPLLRKFIGQPLQNLLRWAGKS
jgi:hypothetical protein